MTLAKSTAGLYARTIEITNGRNPFEGFENLRYKLSDDISPGHEPKVDLPSTDLSPEDQILSYILNAEGAYYDRARPVFGQRDRGYVDFLPDGTGEIVTGTYWAGEVVLSAEGNEVELHFTSTLLLLGELRDYASNRRALDWYFEHAISKFF